MVLSFVMILMFSLVLGRVFYLQIIHGKEYQENFTLRIQKPISIEAARGNIYDCNGELLAYNELVYSIAIADEFEDTREKNEIFNKQIAEIIGVLHQNGEEIYNDFPIKYDESDGTYSYNVTGTSLERFLADVFGQSSYENLEYNKEYGFDEANATAEQVMYYLKNDKYKFKVSEEYDEKTAYEIVVIRYAVNANRYSKYNTTTVAVNVCDATVAYMNEHSDTLIGVTIEEDMIRKYNDSVYFASIIGYTGKISEEEYDTLSATDDSYTRRDIVGKSGLEQYYESYLRGVNGEKEVYVDSLGKITEEISNTDSVAGCDLYLSIDADTQRATYLLLEQEIAGIVYSNIVSGNITLNDVYFALIDNNVIDIKHFKEDNASATEKSLNSVFLSAQSAAISELNSEICSSTGTSTNDMSPELLDYVTFVMASLKENNVLVSSAIDVEDETYIKWKNGTISPNEYLKHCISMQWIDISKLNIEDKYADSSEIFSALCAYINGEISTDNEFSKLVYKYMIEKGQVSGQSLCLILFDQGVLDYDSDSVAALTNGSTSAYSFLLEKINNIEITPAQLALDPCTGSCVITDVKTGEIKALVSYPGYDNNRLANGVDAEYYESLRQDNSNPQWNYATQERTAPGSTYKMVTSVAGLAEGILTTESQIECTGIFEEVDNKPKCWIYPNGTHHNINVSEALRDSCNVFYYTTGYNLASKDKGVYNDPAGIAYLEKYASIFGLNEKTGIEIVENTPEVATEYPVMAAIGQSDNNFTTVSLSRYVTAVASGNLYDYQLMSKIVDANDQVIASYEPKSTSVTSVLDTEGWQAIHSGMRMVIENMSEFDEFPVEIAGKTGTAQQVETRPNHALFVGYAPYSDPEISIATRIAYGYSSHNAASVSKNIISYYYGVETLEDILAKNASGANSSSNNAVTD